jgi:hypothetical protein
VRELDLKELQEKLEKYKDFDDIKKSVEVIVKEEELYNRLKMQILELTSYEVSLKTLQETIRKLDPIKKVIIPDHQACETTLSDFEWLKEKEQQVILKVQIINKLKSIEKIESPDPIECINLTEEFQWIQEKEEDLGFLAQEVKKLREITSVVIPEDKEIENILQATSQLVSWENTYVKLSGSLKVQEEQLQIINSLVQSIDLNAIDTIFKDCSRITDIEEQFMAVASQAKKSREELKLMILDLESKQANLAKINVCPLCERPL